MTSGRCTFAAFDSFFRVHMNFSVTVIEELREKLHQLSAEKERAEFQLSSKYVLRITLSILSF